MKFRLVDLLACPICKHFPLKLDIFEVYEITPPEKIVKCELYCSYHGGFVKDLERTECEVCYSKEIKSGLLTCPSCKRWYPIEDDIPRMLPDEIRQQREDLAFLRKWRDKISSEILSGGKPFNLNQVTSGVREKN
ncbi:MAG TPA: Trm112 family protein [Candidatus Caldiarchaeum subterraneum]|uniref:Trm112 family protein n=1 Tax=Caldiarchaeum subterraneum TaxID=311458 RepID=A0A833EBG1_CALS0|nr:Trm112 family protein [Candidatus Caldarchaeum subterraneum]